MRSHSAGLSVSHVDPADLDALRAALQPNTAFIWIETPSNPTLRLADLEAIAAIGRERGVLTVVDNTFASPAVRRPARSRHRYRGAFGDQICRRSLRHRRRRDRGA
ncbi:MAG: PLP-dependent aspartate aminotransferase family protein [Rhodopseudomonas palustris]|nr:PLP-dependent aspartate aminotransferase family protein [Rhodopseudomonas palustris]